MNSLTDKEINRASDGIDKALSTATRSNRGEVAFRILSVVRNLNDHIAFKIWKDVRPDQKMDIWHASVCRNRRSNPAGQPLSDER